MAMDNLLGRYFTFERTQSIMDDEGIELHGFQIVNQIGPKHYEIEEVGRGGILMGKEKSTHWVKVKRYEDREIFSADEIESLASGVYYADLKNVEAALVAWSMVRCLVIDSDPGWQNYKDYVFGET